jgi:hypothetical protein
MEKTIDVAYDVEQLCRYSTSTWHNGYVTTKIDRKHCGDRTDLKLGDAIVFEQFGCSMYAGQFIGDLMGGKHQAIVWGDEEFGSSYVYRRGQIVDIDMAYVAHIIKDVPQHSSSIRYCTYKTNRVIHNKLNGCIPLEKLEVDENYREFVVMLLSLAQLRARENLCKECIEREREVINLEGFFISKDELYHCNGAHSYVLVGDIGHIEIHASNYGELENGVLKLNKRLLSYLPFEYKSSPCILRACRLEELNTKLNSDILEIINVAVEKERVSFDDYIKGVLGGFPGDIKSMKQFKQVYRSKFPGKKRLKYLTSDTKEEDCRVLWCLYKK